VFSKVKTKSEQGKINRRKGANFEREIRKKLEFEQFIVFKNPNNLIDGKYTQAKQKFNPFTKRPLMIGAGFPDFLVYNVTTNLWFFVECKTNGYLTKEEREKVDWIHTELGIRVFVARKKDKEILFKEV
jgi:hypothetical protein